jgi:hypothetical protein
MSVKAFRDLCNAMRHDVLLVVLSLALYLPLIVIFETRFSDNAVVSYLLPRFSPALSLFLLLMIGPVFFF